MKTGRAAAQNGEFGSSSSGTSSFACVLTRTAGSEANPARATNKSRTGAFRQTFMNSSFQGSISVGAAIVSGCKSVALAPDRDFLFLSFAFAPKTQYKIRVQS